MLEYRRSVGTIPKGDVVEDNLSGDLRQGCATRIIGGLRSGVQHIAQALDRNADLLKLLPEVHHTQQRSGDLSGQHGEGDQLTDAQGPIDDLIGSDPHDGNGRGLLDKGRHLAGYGDQTGRAETGLDVPGQLFIPAALERWLDGQSLHGLNAAHGLDQKRLVLRARG